MDLLAFFGMPLISVFLMAIGSVPYALWVTRRGPSPHARWGVIGAYVAVVGYLGAVLYGLAFTSPIEVCGKRTLDDDFPLEHVTVGWFPPDVACYWSDSGTYGPSHPTALGTWTMWAGIAVLVVAVTRMLVGRKSRSSRWARAGMMWSPIVAGVCWAVRIHPVMALSRTDLENKCFDWQVSHLLSAPGGEILGADRSVFPLSVICRYTEGKVGLIETESLLVYLCVIVFAACAGTILYQVGLKRS
ncbi:hypothetical protein [Streptomyces sp. NPDC048650]|uniref:hypothetical protein n=1 Tax=Streptomyces sp. NPDC048650 TaxID=3365583 RepID=UPI003715C104